MFMLQFSIVVELSAMIVLLLQLSKAAVLDIDMLLQLFATTGKAEGSDMQLWTWE